MRCPAAIGAPCFRIILNVVCEKNGNGHRDAPPCCNRGALFPNHPQSSIREKRKWTPRRATLLQSRRPVSESPSKWYPTKRKWAPRRATLLQSRRPVSESPSKSLHPQAPLSPPLPHCGLGQTRGIRQMHWTEALGNLRAVGCDFLKWLYVKGLGSSVRLHYQQRYFVAHEISLFCHE